MIKRCEAETALTWVPDGRLLFHCALLILQDWRLVTWVSHGPLQLLRRTKIRAKLPSDSHPPLRFTQLWKSDGEMFGMAVEGVGSGVGWGRILLKQSALTPARCLTSLGTSEGLPLVSCSEVVSPLLDSRTESRSLRSSVLPCFDCNTRNLTPKHRIRWTLIPRHLCFRTWRRDSQINGTS